MAIWSFHAEITDAAGKPTSADLGNTYRRLMCIAFDLAVLRAYSNDPFPRFVYHDGVFESLDDRKKRKFAKGDSAICEFRDSVSDYVD